MKDSDYHARVASETEEDARDPKAARSVTAGIFHIAPFLLILPLWRFREEIGVVNNLRIPMKAATYSNLIAATLPI